MKNWCWLTIKSDENGIVCARFIDVITRRSLCMLKIHGLLVCIFHRHWNQIIAILMKFFSVLNSSFNILNRKWKQQRPKWHTHTHKKKSIQNSYFDDLFHALVFTSNVFIWCVCCVWFIWYRFVIYLFYSLVKFPWIIYFWNAHNFLKTSNWWMKYESVHCSSWIIYKARTHSLCIDRKLIYIYHS